MRITTDLSRGIQEVLARWHQASVPVIIERKSLSIHSENFSALLRILKKEEITHINGKRVKLKREKSERNCLRITCHMGKDERGSSVTYVGFGEVPETPEVLKREIDEQMDLLIKKGVVEYFAGIAEAVLTTESNRLMPQEPTPRTVYVPRKRKIDPGLRQFEYDLLEAMEKVQKVKGVRKIGTRIGNEIEESLFIDTAGSNIHQKKGLLELAYELEGDNARGKAVRASESLYFTRPELYKKEYLERKVEKSILEFSSRRKAIRINSGPYPVLLDGAAAGVLVHEALAAHLLSGKYVVEHESLVFSSERMGKLILPEELSIIDDPTDEDRIGSYRFDEEGVLGQKVVLVENGILKNYLLDNFSAARLSRKLNFPLSSNGHSRSAWAVDGGEVVPPEPRVTNLFVKTSAPLTQEEILEMLCQTIKDQKTGIGLIVEGGGGRVNVEDGTFTLYPLRIWEVDSKMNKRMVENVRLLGNPDEMFNSILGTGLPYRSGFGLCGAISGFVPTQHHAPSFLMARMTAISEKEDYSTKRLLERIS